MLLRSSKEVIEYYKWNIAVMHNLNELETLDLSAKSFSELIFKN